MSRIGKKLIVIPKDVEVILKNNEVTVKGAKGTLSQVISSDIIISKNDSEKTVTVTPVVDEKKHYAIWGLSRVLVQNMITGVSEGFKKVLEIEGVGFKAEKKGKNVQVSAGYSHPILYVAPEGIQLDIEGPLKIVVTGIDKCKVGQVASEIRSIRKPEPYKGKGIRYSGEVILRKAGKTGK